MPGGGGGIAVSGEKVYGEHDCDDPTCRGCTKVDESSAPMFEGYGFPDILE
jgi:hypothetical protein